MPTVLITGANRGLGLEFARQYAAAGGRSSPPTAPPCPRPTSWHWAMAYRELRYDALDDASARDVADRLKGHPIDVVLMNAGTSHDQDRPVEAIDAAHWQETLLTNTWAPFHLASLLESNLRLGDRKVLAAVSSLAASMEIYDVPRQYAYRASKAALNQMWRNLSIDWRDWGCICLALRPGRVRTRMTGFQGTLTPAQSVTGMRQVIDDATPEASGLHWGHDGKVVPW